MKPRHRFPVWIPILVLWSLIGLSPRAASEVLVIRQGRFYPVTGPPVDDAVLVIRDGRIAALGPGIEIPPHARILDAVDLHVIPGMVDGFTNLGTVDTASQDRDDDEVGDPLTPHLRIVDSVNPDNRFIPLARAAGITTILCAPGEGNLLSGQSALMRLAGRSFEDVVLRFPAAVHGSLGELPKKRYGAQNRMPMTRMGSAALLRRILTEARDYSRRLEKTPRPPRDLKLEALLPVLRGELPLFLRANRRDDLLTALRIADEFDLRLVINHGAEAGRLAEELASRKIPVILGPVFEHRLLEETGGASPETPFLLHRAGVKFAFQTGSYRYCRDLLYQAQIAIRHGLPREAALRALTLAPAEIFGAGDRLGSLEPGKDADLVLFDGDPLDARSRVRTVIIGGRVVFNGDENTGE